MSSDKEFPQEKPKLTSITVRGFKKISAERTMELSRVNFILGPNNAGKTSFFQAYELASWVQKHGSVNGLRRADVRNFLRVRPGSINSDYPLEKALDFTVSARSKSGDFIQETSFIGDEHRVKMWGFEIDGFTLRLWPDAEGQL